MKNTANTLTARKIQQLAACFGRPQDSRQPWRRSQSRDPFSEESACFEWLFKQYSLGNINGTSHIDIKRHLEVVISTKSRGKTRKIIKMPGVRHLKTDGEYTLYRITAAKAAVKLFRFTSWRTIDAEDFNSRTPKEFYYVEKDHEPYLLLHTGTGQITTIYGEDFKGILPILQPYATHVSQIAYTHATEIVNGRWKPGEKAILKNPKYACWYAINIIKGRWRAAEPLIRTSAQWSYTYALRVIKGRWPAGEKIISQCPWCACWYAKEVIKGRWPKGEKAIGSHPEYAYTYASIVVNGPWPDGEEAISRSAARACNYAEYVLKARWPPGEAAIMKDPDPEWIVRYASHVLKGRWPEAEPVILKDARYIISYVGTVIKGRWPEAEDVLARMDLMDKYKSELDWIKR